MSKNANECTKVTIRKTTAGLYGVYSGENSENFLFAGVDADDILEELAKMGNINVDFIDDRFLYFNIDSNGGSNE